MNWKALLIVLATITMSGYGIQTEVRTRTKPLGNEISVADAGVKCRDFVQLLGLPAQDWTKPHALLEKSRLNRSERKWFLKGALYGVDVDARTGEILWFSNLQREGERHRRNGRTGRVFCSISAARALISALARLHITPSATLWDFSYVTDAEATQRGTGLGQFGATFVKDGSVTPTIALDIHDGVPLHIQLK